MPTVISVALVPQGPPPPEADLWIADHGQGHADFATLCTLAGGRIACARTESVECSVAVDGSAGPDWAAICAIQGARVALTFHNDDVGARPAGGTRDPECDLNVEHWAAPGGESNLVFHGAEDWESETVPLASGGTVVRITQLESQTPWGCAVA